MVRIPSPPPVCIYDVADEDGAVGLVLVLDTLTVLPVPGEVGRTVQVSYDKNPCHSSSKSRIA